MQTATAETKRAVVIECDHCGNDIPSGEVVVLGGALLGVSCGCAWDYATSLLGNLLAPDFTPCASSLKDYAEANAVMHVLNARIARRLSGRF